MGRSYDSNYTTIYDNDTVLYDDNELIASYENGVLHLRDKNGVLVLATTQKTIDDSMVINSKEVDQGSLF
jgi:hypothetical protein